MPRASQRRGRASGSCSESRLCTSASGTGVVSSAPSASSTDARNRWSASASITARTRSWMSARSSLERVELADRRRELVVELGQHPLLDVLQLDVEAHRLAGQVLGRVVLGHRRSRCRAPPPPSSRPGRARAPRPAGRRRARPRSREPDAALERLAVGAARRSRSPGSRPARRRARPPFSSATVSRSRSISPVDGLLGHLARRPRALEALVGLHLGRRLDLDLGGERERRALGGLVRPVDRGPVDGVDPGGRDRPRVPGR